MSARTIRVLLAFSIVNFVFPSWPAIRPVNVIRNLRNRAGNFSITDGASEMVAMQGFDIFDLEGVQIEIVQSEESN